jgi:hypothetical protein
MSDISKVHYYLVTRACVNNVWYYRLYINGEAVGLFPDEPTAKAELEKIKNQTKQNTNQ